MNTPTTTPTEAEVTTLDQSSVDSATISAIAGDIENVLQGKSRQASVAALIALAILNIRNDYTGENLASAIYETSMFISMLTSPTVDGEVIITPGDN